MTTSLEGKTALVTGAGRGIGRATALQLAEAGVAVALVARSEDQLAETADRVNELGGTALVVPADLGELSEVSRAIQQTNDELGVVDVLINDAAVVWPLGPSVSVDSNEWAAAIAINVVAVAALSFALLPAMSERNWGRIVNVSSGIAAHPGSMIGMNAYAAGKAALEAHTINLAAELAGSGVTVNAFGPGSVDTAMQAWIRGQEPAQIGAALHERFARSYAEGAMITPEQSARSLLPHLSSDATGQIWNASESS
ncbi:MAG: putative oxidoreductase [Acidimicrobiaceae bacterium]|nr:putative oxidoreductase [Acidimicrobiaceae bacterium]